MNCQKEKFNLETEVTYLNGAYMSPLLKSVEAAGLLGMQKKRNPFHFSEQEFFGDVIKLKKLYAKLIHEDRSDLLAIIPSVSYGFANAAMNINPGKRKKIIIAAEQFPSNYYAWEPLCQKYGIRIETVSPPESNDNRGAIWNENILNAIDDNTALVALAPVHWADGTKFLIKEISNKAKKHGSLLALDGTQSFGALPYDQREVQADIIVAASYKWLMGPYSIGFAYYSDAFAEGRPIENSWLNRQDSEDFSQLVNYQPKYKGGSQRYEMGEAPNFINVPMAIAAAQQLIEWGPQQVQTYCQDITRSTIENLKGSGFIIEHDDFRAAHLFGIRIPPQCNMSKIKEALINENIIVSYRGDAIRVAPNVYNTVDEVKKLEEILLRQV